MGRLSACIASFSVAVAMLFANVSIATARDVPSVAAFTATLGLEPIDPGSLRSAGALTQAGGPLIATHLTTAE